MIVSRIEGTTRVFVGEGYLNLPVRDLEVGSRPFMLTAWEPTPDELERLNKGAKIHLYVGGNVHPPVRLGVGGAP